MKNKYTGTVRSERTKSKRPLKWISFVSWLISIVFSLAPIYLILLRHLSENEGIVLREFAFRCFVIEDTLWIFSTLLLFSIINYVIKCIDALSRNKTKKTKNQSFGNAWHIILILIGAVCFLTTEFTWLYFELTFDLNSVVLGWPIWLSVALIFISLMVSTPLQINSLKGDE